MKSVERVECADVLVGGLHALAIVASISATPALAVAATSRKLPSEVLGILNAGIGAARAERRDLMRGVADKNHAAMHEALACGGT